MTKSVTSPFPAYTHRRLLDLLGLSRTVVLDSLNTHRIRLACRLRKKRQENIDGNVLEADRDNDNHAVTSCVSFAIA